MVVDVDDLDELFRLMAHLESCAVRGHQPVRMYTGSGTGPCPDWVPATCERCGEVLPC